MRCLERNKKPFYYCLYLREEDMTDSAGDYSGETRIVYAEPVLAKYNISPATGNTSTEQFGNDIQYDKVIVLDDMSCPINENSVLFVDSSPSYDAGGNLQYDYIVKKVAPSINSISIAIAKVKVS
jgi:hypothetical protein